MSDATPSPPASRARDHERVEQEYGVQKWPAVERLIDERSSGEGPGGTALARVHRLVVRDYAYAGDPLQAREVLLDGRRQPLAGAFSVGGAERLVADSVVDACTEHTDLVIELGCGWGWHLLGSWLAGGPRGALYVGAEFTDAGCRAAQRLADLDPELRFRAHAFDYHDPTSLDALGTFREAVVLTVHSIEQIPHVAPGLIKTIAGLADSVRCLHFEPVGWQVSADGRGSSQAYAESHDYNRDLIAVLRAEEAAGVLEIDAIQQDIVGLNPANSTTHVRWNARS